MRQGREHSVPLLHRMGKCYRWVWSPRWDLVALQLQADSPLQPPVTEGVPAGTEPGGDARPLT